MYNTQIAVAIAAASVLVTVVACSNSESDTQSSASPAATSAASSPTPAPAEKTHNDADVAFAQAMVPHHQQAVEMSDILMGKQGTDPRVVSLIEEIKAAQAPEIESMRGWLNDWGVPAEPSTSGGMPGHDMSGHGSMPGMSGDGMMTPADMTALQNAEGTEASRLFLTQMIEHHRGAISMAQREVDNGQYAPAVDMARAIVSSQQAEIDSMEQLLRSL